MQSRLHFTYSLSELHHGSAAKVWRLRPFCQSSSGAFSTECCTRFLLMNDWDCHLLDGISNRRRTAEVKQSTTLLIEHKLRLRESNAIATLAIQFMTKLKYKYKYKYKLIQINTNTSRLRYRRAIAIPIFSKSSVSSWRRAPWDFWGNSRTILFYPSLAPILCA